MKKTVNCLIAVLICAVSSAQTTSAEFKARYESQVRNVGTAGLGVMGIINNWQKAFPDDPEAVVANFTYNLAKSQKTSVRPKNMQRYLGAKPTVVLKGANGEDVNYFEETFYDDGYFAAAMDAIDKAIDMRPDELRYRFYKITSMISYEKESPDMAYSLIKALLEYNFDKRPVWTVDGEPASEDQFLQAIGEYCYSFYSLGTENGYEYFRMLSESMTRYYPKNAVFYSNIGSYWQVVKKNNKQAMKFYNKALKLDPDNYAAKRNVQIIQSSQSKKGRPSK